MGCIIFSLTLCWMKAPVRLHLKASLRHWLDSLGRLEVYLIEKTSYGVYPCVVLPFAIGLYPYLRSGIDRGRL